MDQMSVTYRLPDSKACGIFIPFYAFPRMMPVVFSLTHCGSMDTVLTNSNSKSVPTLLPFAGPNPPRHLCDVLTVSDSLIEMEEGPLKMLIF